MIKNSIICIMLAWTLTIGCSTTRNVKQFNTSIGKAPASQGTRVTMASLSSLLGNFKKATLPYPNSVDTFVVKKFPSQDDIFLRKTLSSCGLITLIDQSDLNIWDFADLSGDTIAMKYLAKDTSTCILPGFIFFKNDNLLLYRYILALNIMALIPITF